MNVVNKWSSSHWWGADQHNVPRNASRRQHLTTCISTRQFHFTCITFRRAWWYPATPAGLGWAALLAGTRQIAFPYFSFMFFYQTYFCSRHGLAGEQQRPSPRVCVRAWGSTSPDVVSSFCFTAGTYEALPFSLPYFSRLLTFSHTLNPVPSPWAVLQLPLCFPHQSHLFLAVLLSFSLLVFCVPRASLQAGLVIGWYMENGHSKQNKIVRVLIIRHSPPWCSSGWFSLIYNTPLPYLTYEITHHITAVNGAEFQAIVEADSEISYCFLLI